MHTCYNLISHSIYYMFQALKVHHQEVSSKDINIMVLCMSTPMVCGVFQ